jgi:hypothetical protein
MDADKVSGVKVGITPGWRIRIRQGCHPELGGDV